MHGGLEWIVDATGCAPGRLRDPALVAALLERIVAEMGLHVVARASHQFPEPAGITAMYLLAESHLTIHTFPETGVVTLNVYCCRPRPTLDWARLLGEVVGARATRVQELVRGEAPR